MYKLVLTIISLCVILLGAVQTSGQCPEGYLEETNAQGQSNCRNPACDAGMNLYGDAIDKGETFPAEMLLDIAEMPRPTQKGPDGQWVGWSIGAYQCPPDPIGLHPNDNWPDACGYEYCNSLIPMPPANLSIQPN